MLITNTSAATKFSTDKLVTFTTFTFGKFLADKNTFSSFETNKTLLSTAIFFLFNSINKSLVEGFETLNS
ncbi:Uncharacterised protein [Chlamydia abortus]|nr:Uncharacterised protein [Chlamydia abortus]SGA30222.1 Uncharacterised protein [Chlamydia abortus]